MEAAFGGEVQFAGYSDSSRSGPRVTFHLADREDLEKFVGKEGKRFMLALCEIADDETPSTSGGSPAPSQGAADAPIAPPDGTGDAPKQPAEKLGPLAILAVRWCRDPMFLGWLGLPDEAAAKRHMQEVCGIESRRELDTNVYAAEHFHNAYRKRFQAYLQERGEVPA